MALVNDYDVVVHGLAAMLRSYRDQVHVVELNVRGTLDEPVGVALYDTFAARPAEHGEIRQLASDPRVGAVAVYSWRMDRQLIAAALAGGADGYIAKSLPARMLVTALHQVGRGEQRVWPSDSASAGVIGGDWPGREEGLTPRESEALALITQGLSNVEVAELMHVSANSLKTIIRSCYRRISVTNRVQAVLWGADHGFLPDRRSPR